MKPTGSNIDAAARAFGLAMKWYRRGEKLTHHKLQRIHKLIHQYKDPIPAADHPVGVEYARRTPKELEVLSARIASAACHALYQREIVCQVVDQHHVAQLESELGKLGRPPTVFELTYFEFLIGSMRTLDEKTLGSEALPHVLTEMSAASPGLWLEFGVASGRTLKLMAASGRRHAATADSFRGRAGTAGYRAAVFRRTGRTAGRNRRCIRGRAALARGSGGRRHQAPRQ